MKKRYNLSVFLLLVLWLTCLVAGYSQQSETVRIAAASDLKFALDSVVSLFRKSNPAVTIQVTYGSSGKLYEQIRNGAPFDIFFSADIDYPKYLEEKKLTSSRIKIYGQGQLVLWSKKIDPSQEGMKALLRTDVRTIAIANPQHAPYGKRAEESLKYYGIYDKVSQKLVLGENISQTAQFVKSGNADVGIVALSLALSKPMTEDQGHYFVIPKESYAKLDQGVVMLSNGATKKGAKQFSDFISDVAAVRILRYYGFLGSDQQ
jgi:molybdate transport system substrate-binding protein